MNEGLSTSEICSCSPGRMGQQVQGRRVFHSSPSEMQLCNRTTCSGQAQGLRRGRPPLVLTIASFKHSCCSFSVFSIACRLFLFCYSCPTLYCRNSSDLLTWDEFHSISNTSTRYSKYLFLALFSGVYTSSILFTLRQMCVGFIWGFRFSRNLEFFDCCFPEGCH